MRVLISGYTGFLGKHITAQLAADHELFGLGRKSVPMPGIQQVYTWDKLNELPEVDWCIHLTGLAHDISDAFSDHMYLDVNFDLTRDLSQALRGKCRHFMFMSSIKALCESDGVHLNEIRDPVPISPYGVSKQLAEDYLAANEPDLGMNIYVLRPVMIYGPGCKGNILSLVRIVKRGIPYPFRDVKNEKSVLYVKNLTYVVQHFVEHGAERGIYHVADPGTLSTFELMKLIAAVLHKPLRSWQIPAFLYARFLKHKEEGSSLRRMIYKLLGNLSVDTGKLDELLGDEKLPFTTTEGLKDWLG